MTLTALLFASLATFLQPRTPPIPVSEATIGPAVGLEAPVDVATNGEISMVVWESDSDRVQAARFTSDGTVLDPLGIELGVGYPVSVVWDGDAFLVLAESGRQSPRFAIHAITPDGELRGTKRFDLNGMFMAATRTADPVRFLFSGDRPSGEPTITILDGDGNAVARNVQLPAPPEDLFSYQSIATADGSGFLVLRSQATMTSPPTGWRVVADRFNLNGDLISSVESGLPVQIWPEDRVARGESGFIFLKQASWIDARWYVYALDEQGVFRGQSSAIGAPQPGTQARLFHDYGRYLMTWSTWVATNERGSYVAEVGGNAAVGKIRRLVPNMGAGTALMINASSRRLMIVAGGPADATDLLAVPLSDDLEEGEPRLLSFSAPMQTDAEVAGGAHGYLVGWSEKKNDRAASTYLRRFAATGSPLDETPLTLGQSESLQILSAGDIYLVGWRSGFRSFIRRLSATDGQWLDPAPVELQGLAAPLLGTNGVDALAVITVICESHHRCAATQKIWLSDALRAEPPVVVTPPLDSFEAAIASNGSDYLLVWSEGFRECNILCAPSPLRIEAVRLRADGTAIDPQPMVIEKDQGSSSSPSVIWAGDRYLVAWSFPEEVRGAAITAEGSVQGTRDFAGTVLETGGRYDQPTPELAVFGTKAVLMTRWQLARVGLINYPMKWTGVTFVGNLPLSDVSTLPRTTLLESDSDPRNTTIRAASRGQKLLVVYDERNASLGGVNRVYLQFFDSLHRRRAAGR